MKRVFKNPGLLMSVVFGVNLLLGFSLQAAVDVGKLRLSPIAQADAKKYVSVSTPLPAAQIANIEFLISLPRVGNTYGHTAFRLTFRGGRSVEAGFVVENFRQGGPFGRAKGNGKMYLELSPASSSTSMSRDKKFKVAYAQILLSPSEQQHFVEILNETAALGLKENYSTYFNNCASVGTKVLQTVVKSVRAPEVDRPAKVVSEYASVGLVQRDAANAVDDQFKYYKKNPYSPESLVE